MRSLIWVMNTTCGMYCQRRKALYENRFSSSKNLEVLAIFVSFGSETTDIITHHKTVFLEQKKTFISLTSSRLGLCVFYMNMKA